MLRAAFALRYAGAAKRALTPELKLTLMFECVNAMHAALLPSYP